jgi:hypothetical protein
MILSKEAQVSAQYSQTRLFPKGWWIRHSLPHGDTRIKKVREDRIGVVDQVGAALKNTATRIEQEVSSVVQKLEESETLKNVWNELKRSADSLGYKIEGSRKKLKGSFKSENDTCEFPDFLPPCVLGRPQCYRFRNPKNIPTAPAPVEGR